MFFFLFRDTGLCFFYKCKIDEVINQWVNIIYFLFQAGQERFRSVTRSYYRGAAGAILTFDVTSRESFNTLANWLNDTRTLASPHIVILLVGNKKDLDEEREVTFLEASNFAQENGKMSQHPNEQLLIMELF